MANRIGKRLMVLSLSRHAIHNTKSYSYEPYVREMNLWCELYETVDVYTNLVSYNEANKHSFAEFKYDNVSLKSLWSYPVKTSIWSRFLHLITIPFLVMQFLFNIHKYDLIHIRNSSLPSAILGVIVRLFRKKTITKWAGGFGPYPGEPLLSKLDRKVAGMPSKFNKTLIYSKSDKPHLITFIPALMSLEEIDEAQNMAARKPHISDTLHLVSIGRLHPTKNFELIIKALNELKPEVTFKWVYHCIGDGVLMPKMKALTKTHNLQNNIVFHGALKFNEAQSIIALSHILIMPGVLEGWPKPIAEAWAHNTFPVAAKRGNIPDILDISDKGLTFEPDAISLANTIKKAYDKLSENEIVNLKAYANELSLETFKLRLRSEIESF